MPPLAIRIGQGLPVAAPAPGPISAISSRLSHRRSRVIPQVVPGGWHLTLPVAPEGHPAPCRDSFPDRMVKLKATTT